MHLLRTLLVLLVAAALPVLSSRGQAIHTEAAYTGEVVGNLSGGIEQDYTYLHNIDLTATLLLERLAGWRGAHAYVYVLGSHGGEPSAFVGDAQTLSNIEADDAWRLYEAWLEQMLFQNRLSLLAGLYDLNSEFDVIETAGLFLNSSFGIGAEFGQSGLNGPSIFPVTSLGARARYLVTHRLYAQSAVLDGVPGDPNRPRRTHVSFDPKEGALLVGEIGYFLGSEGPQSVGDFGRRAHRAEHVSRLGGPTFGGKLAAGVWHYTSRFPRIEVETPDLEPRLVGGSTGAYVFLEQRLTGEGGNGNGGLSCFGRAGAADPRVNRFRGSVTGGCAYRGPLRGRPDDQVGLAFSSAFNGEAYRDLPDDGGLRPTRTETVLEGTYAAPFSESLAVQLDLQYIINPGTSLAIGNALVVGMRLQLGI